MDTPDIAQSLRGLGNAANAGADEIVRLRAQVRLLQARLNATRAPIDTDLIPGATPTHICKVCGASWHEHSNGSWSLCSKQCGVCCDNEAMGDQIEALPPCKLTQGEGEVNIIGDVPDGADYRDNRGDGQQYGYAVLSESARSRGFVQPYRDSYVHNTCGAVTRMSRPIAETYARDPHFYTGTYCVNCRAHFPLSEFVWDGTSESMQPATPKSNA